MKMIKTTFLTIMSTLLLAFGLSSASAQDYTELDCLVKPEIYINLSAPIAGVLESILVTKSDFVKKGQVVAQMEASVEAANVEIAEHEAIMDNQIKEKKILLEYALRKEQRIAGLVKDNALSEQEYDDAKTERASAKTKLLQIKLDQTKNKLKLILAKAELERKTIKSPINGIVVEEYLMIGEVVNNEPILRLAKIDPLLVEVVAPFELFGLIERDMIVEIRPDLPANSQYQATVSIIDRIIDAASGSFSIRLTLPNPGDALIGGTRCTARFPITPPTRQIKNTHTDTGKDELPDDFDELPDDIKDLIIP